MFSLGRVETAVHSVTATSAIEADEADIETFWIVLGVFGCIRICLKEEFGNRDLSYNRIEADGTVFTIDWLGGGWWSKSYGIHTFQRLNSLKRGVNLLPNCSMWGQLAIFNVIREVCRNASMC